MALTPEIVVVVVSGIVGVSVPVTAAIIERKKQSFDGQERRSQTDLCAAHSGMVASIASLKELTEEIREDIKTLLINEKAREQVAAEKEKKKHEG